MKTKDSEKNTMTLNFQKEGLWWFAGDLAVSERGYIKYIITDNPNTKEKYKSFQETIKDPDIFIKISRKKFYKKWMNKNIKW